LTIFFPIEVVCSAVYVVGQVESEPGMGHRDSDAVVPFKVLDTCMKALEGWLRRWGREVGN
jgi:hypothetical protein